MDVDEECGGGVGGNSYELLVDDGFVYDQVEHSLELCDSFRMIYGKEIYLNLKLLRLVIMTFFPRGSTLTTTTKRMMGSKSKARLTRKRSSRGSSSRRVMRIRTTRTIRIRSQSEGLMQFLQGIEINYAHQKCSRLNCN